MHMQPDFRKQKNYCPLSYVIQFQAVVHEFESRRRAATDVSFSFFNPNILPFHILCSY